MNFVFKKWEFFCKQLLESDIKSISIRTVLERGLNTKYLILKHDVETNVKNAYKMACIEERYGHKGSYYVQAYLLDSCKNVEILKKIQSMGHEITYHHDVMDFSKGDLEKALIEFKNNINKFEERGFSVKTVCQHGNPAIERIGYTSNRDFFRSTVVQSVYRELTDVMVDFKEKASTEYEYFSDAGRVFKLICDPINNDRNESSCNDIPFNKLEEVFKYIKKTDGSVIVSVHPHRWSELESVQIVKKYIFSFIKFIVKKLMKIEVFRNIINKYYYLAKKI